MRQISTTILLLILAVLTVGLAIMRMTEDGLAGLFGLPPSKRGEQLYRFDPLEIQDIYINGNGAFTHCRKGPGGWEIVSPWKDRMDPRTAQAIFQFVLGTSVEGAIPADKVESANLGLEDGRINFAFADKTGDIKAKFVLGHKTAWFGTDLESGDSIPTVYVRPRDKGRKDYFYACTDPNNIHGVLADGFSKLRDHHPFLFHPNITQTLRVKDRTGELQLSRENPKELWSIVKPLGLKSNREQLVALMQGLYDLRAVSVKDRSEVTLPGSDPQEIQQIGMRFFNTPQEILLEIYPPETPNASTVLATISNRPGAVFELPLQSSPAPHEGDKPLVGIQNLPLKVNELRDPTLSAIDVRAIKNILISPSESEDILIQRARPEDRFSILIDGAITQPSETALFSLIKTVTESPVLDFISDTATDLAPYGLDDPFLTLRLGSFDGGRIRIDFGRTKDGTVHAIREGTTTVVTLDPATLNLIPTRSWEWRNPQLFQLSAVDISGIKRMITGQAPLELSYQFGNEKWTALQGEEDKSIDLIKKRADRFLQDLLSLQVDNWLPEDHAVANQVLESPEMIIQLLHKTFADDGTFIGVSSPTLSIGTTKGGSVYYGRLDTQTHPFILKKATVQKLKTDLFELE